MSSLNKTTVVPIEESFSFKGPADGNWENIACSVVLVVGAQFRPLLATLLSQAVTFFSKELCRGLEDLVACYILL